MPGLAEALGMGLCMVSRFGAHLFLLSTDGAVWKWELHDDVLLIIPATFDDDGL